MMIYVTLNADLQPIELFSERDAQLVWQRVDDEQEAAWSLTAIGEYARVDHALLRGAWLGFGSDSLARHRIQAVEVADPPEGHVLEGYTLAVDGADVVTAAPTYATAPTPPRRELRKSLVMGRVFALGKASAIKTLFDGNFELQAKWFSPDWPNVYADDEGLLAALSAIGCSPSEIAAITA